MRDIRIALIGFGNVGRAFSRLLLDKYEEIQYNHKFSIKVVGIATGHHGIVIDPDGINLSDALETTNISHLRYSSSSCDCLKFLEDCDADILCENSPVNYESGQPAISYIQKALIKGMHVTTANKGPVVHAYHDLKKLADTAHRKFYFESAVMDGAPIFSLFRNCLPVSNLQAIFGVLNSTTNLILTLMEAGYSFDDAVKHCQKIGIAETDPSGDIDGWDAAVKISALVTVLMGNPLKPFEVKRLGIRDISSSSILEARKLNSRWKLVCKAEKFEDKVIAEVEPQLVRVDSPLFNVSGTTSLVQFKTDVLGLLTIIETDPGPRTTAYGLLADLINIFRDKD